MGIDISKCYFLSMPGRKPLRTNRPITHGQHIELNFCLLGGSNQKNLNVWINELEYPVGFFECTTVDRVLRNQPMSGYVICLGPYGLLLLQLVLSCLERAHSQKHSYNGKFTLDDFAYDTETN